VKSLWSKFFVLLLAVSLIALSAAFYLRQMMVKDFRNYLEGEYLDQVYRITAELEGSHELAGGWDERALVGTTIRALMLGMEIKVLERHGRVLMDTENALERLTPLMERRVLSMIGDRMAAASGEFTPYPLFLRGERIGVISVRPLSGDRSALFVQRSNRFLFLSLLLMGGIAVLASLLVSRRLTNPLKSLVDQTLAIRRGELEVRTEITGEDEIGKLSHAFNEMADDLKLQESLRRKLIANVAHELRTPLGAIRGELEGMIDGVLKSDQEQLRSLYEETGRLGAMLDGIDDLTQAQASSLTLEKQMVELKTFLGNIGERFRGKAKEKDVMIMVEAGEDSFAWADPDRLSQIIINLLDNAIRAAPGKGTVTLRSSRGTGCSIVEVADTGKGISEEELPFIFERFFRGAGGGLGLGLAIVKELVDAHGGEITVHSEVGKGTTVRVTLPGRLPAGSEKRQG